MNKYIFTILCISIICICTQCEIDPPFAMYKFYVQNMSNDTIVCQYNYSNYDTCGVNRISIAGNETKIIHYKNGQDTINYSGIPSFTFKEMLFLGVQGDTLLYVNPMVDSLWIIEDTFADSETHWGYKLKYQFYKQ